MTNSELKLIDAAIEYLRSTGHQSDDVSIRRLEDFIEAEGGEGLWYLGTSDTVAHMVANSISADHPYSAALLAFYRSTASPSEHTDTARAENALRFYATAAKVGFSGRETADGMAEILRGAP